MTRKIRTNPNPKHREDLKGLERKGLLVRKLIGIRNIIDAECGSVRSLGLNVPDVNGEIYTPDNLNVPILVRRATVPYEGQRAYLHASVEWKYRDGTIPCGSEFYPSNPRADALLGQSGVRGDNLHVLMGGVYGEAILITDVRAHWLIAPRHLPNAEALSELDEALMTDRRVTDIGQGLTLLFKEEPCEEDLVTVALKYS